MWAAGVTYKRSLEARTDEAVSSDPYDRVYVAARPELFFKATANRVRGHGQEIFIRSDSTWDVPEPELAVVCNSRMEVVGYTIGNDVSSRSIEGENALYVPQAKVFDGSCALGPAIALAWDYSPSDRAIELEISRSDSVVYRNSTSTSAMRRQIPELVDYLARDQRFDAGCVLLTGTGIVPPSDFTLQEGDVVTIRIDGIGELTNPVRRHIARSLLKVAWRRKSPLANFSDGCDDQSGQWFEGRKPDGSLVTSFSRTFRATPRGSPCAPAPSG